ncbi:helix-turn-helix domain-containing protein [bacterium]|nr:helix-turn-helix domain-containing protein [bacterium]
MAKSKDKSGKAGLPERLLSATDLAEYLGVGEHTIYRWCKSRKIPHFSLNTSYRFDPGEIKTWLERKHRDPEEEPRGDGGEEDSAAADDELSA